MRLVVLIWTLWSAAAPAETCTAHLGRPRYAYAAPGHGERPVIVGSGPYTTTWLVHGDDGTPLAQKRYRSRARLDNDVAAFSLLRRIAVGGGFFAVPRNLRVEAAPSPHEAALVSPFVRGRSVASVLDDPAVDPNVKATIEARYAHALHTLAASPYGRSFRIFGPRGRPLDARAVLVGSVYGTKLILKPDNVFVDPWTLALTVIDPY